MATVSLGRAELEPLRRVPQIARLLTGFAIRGRISFKVACVAGRLPLAQWIERVSPTPHPWWSWDLDHLMRAACAAGRHRVVLWVINHFGFPAAHCLGTNHHEAFVLAAANGHARMLYALLAAYMPLSKFSMPYRENVVGRMLTNAGQSDNGIGLMTWLLRRYDAPMPEYAKHMIFRKACDNVDLPTLMWLNRKDRAIPLVMYPPTEGGFSHLSGVARMGDLRAAKWMGEHFDFDHFARPEVPREAVVRACRFGRLPMVRWLVSRYGLATYTYRDDVLDPTGWRGRALIAAAYGPYPATAHWVLRQLVRPARKLAALCPPSD